LLLFQPRKRTFCFYFNLASAPERVLTRTGATDTPRQRYRLKSMTHNRAKVDSRDQDGQLPPSEPFPEADPFQIYFSP
jgi:hypothetical protein